MGNSISRNSVVVRHQVSRKEAIEEASGEGLAWFLSIIGGVISMLTVPLFLYPFISPLVNGPFGVPTVLSIGVLGGLAVRHGLIALGAYSVADKSLRAINITVNNWGPKVMFRKRTVLHEGNLYASSPTPSVDFLYGTSNSRWSSNSLYHGKTSAVWTRKGIVLEQVLTPTDETIWDNALETIGNVYAR